MKKDDLAQQVGLEHCRKFRLLNGTDIKKCLPDRERLQLLAAFKRSDEPPWPIHFIRHDPTDSD